MSKAPAKKTSRRKLVPEFELPPILLAAVGEYVGARRLGKLTSEQRGHLADLANRTARDVGAILEGTYVPPDRVTAKLRVEELEREADVTD